MGAWDGFHVFVSSKLKLYFSFKKLYSISNFGLASYNKKFLYCAVGAPGSTDDARMLRNSAIYQKIVTGHAIPDRVMEKWKNTFGNCWRHSFSEARLVDRRFSVKIRPTEGRSTLARSYAVLASCVKMHMAC